MLHVSANVDANLQGAQSSEEKRILSLQQLELASLALTRFRLFSHLVLKLRAGINWFEEIVATSSLDATSLIWIKRAIVQRFITV